MRVTWIAVAVFLLDQFSKFALQFTHVDKNITLLDGALSILIKQQSGITVTQLNQALLNSNSWVLLGALITIPLLISRGNALFHFITLRALLGLQLTAGGILSYAFDYLLRSATHNPVEIRLMEAFSLKAGIADLALISGFILLIYVLLSGTTRIGSKIRLKQASPATLNLSPLPRGVDNIHIDVQLSPAFCGQFSKVVKQVSGLVIDSVLKGRPIPATPTKLFMECSQSFQQLHRDALNRAKTSGEPQLIDLLYLALLKQLHGDVTNVVSNYIRQTRESAQAQSRRVDSRHIEKLSLEKERIIAAANQLMFDGIVGQQLPNLYKGIKAFLGSSRSFAMDAMRAPMLTSNGADNSWIQFYHYLLFGQGKYSTMSFMELDRVLDEQLHEYLDLIEITDELEAQRKKNQSSAGNAAANLSRPSVLAHPDNITILFDRRWSQEKLNSSSPFNGWRRYHKYRSQLRFQQRLVERLISGINKEGVAEWVAAVYEVRKLLNRANPEISPQLLSVLLIESKNSKELKQRLQQQKLGAGIQTLAEQLGNSCDAIHRSLDKVLSKHLYTFMRDFANYRRDLQLLHHYQHAANEIVLLQDEKSLQTSRSNFTLYEFLLPDERTQENSEIRSHIIIKADLRGSTEVTDKLNQMALNPATHFDRNFFSPINEVIKEYDAEKVFIEGDAIILILNDYAGSHSHLIASRACGLAAAILRVVAKQNKELLCYGLPTLELGIGIAYSNESPRFLFDGDHKITISPAINRGDRLSACAWSVRNWRERIKAPETHVEVYQPSERALGHGEKAQKDMVYNLNGILIEPEVFELLCKEISPKRIVNKLPHMQDSRLFAIKVADRDGINSSLIIRRAPVKVYDPEYTLEECPVVEGRVFYEVIHEEKIINSLRTRPNKTSV